MNPVYTSPLGIHNHYFNVYFDSLTNFYFIEIVSYSEKNDSYRSLQFLTIRTTPNLPTSESSVTSVTPSGVTLLYT